MWLLTLIAGFVGGICYKVLLDSLKRIEARIAMLRKPEEHKPASGASFAEPTRAEAIALLEQERVEALNQK